MMKPPPSSVRPAPGSSRSTPGSSPKGTKARQRLRPDDAAAFLPDPRDTGTMHTDDELAEVLAEDFVASATSAEGSNAAVSDETLPEEVGGPFLSTTIGVESDEMTEEDEGEMPAEDDAASRG